MLTVNREIYYRFISVGDFLFLFFTLENYTHKSCHFSVADDYIFVNCTILQHISGLVLNLVIQA